MIKCEVIFDGNVITVNGVNIEIEVSEYGVFFDVGLSTFSCLEDAITYCMEQSNV